MAQYVYKVIPAPAKGRKAPGVKGAEARFAHGLEEAINALAGEGWEYLRADILPSEERQGLTSTHTVYRSVLIFRRQTGEDENATGEDRAYPPLTARRQAPEADRMEDAPGDGAGPAEEPRLEPAAQDRAEGDAGEADTPGPEEDGETRQR